MNNSDNGKVWKSIGLLLISFIAWFLTREGNRSPSLDIQSGPSMPFTASNAFERYVSRYERFIGMENTFYEFAPATNARSWNVNVASAWCINVVNDAFIIDDAYQSTFVVYQEVGDSDWLVTHRHPDFDDIGCDLRVISVPTPRPTRNAPIRDVPTTSANTIGLTQHPPVAVVDAVPTARAGETVEQRTLEHESVVYDVAWSPDGRYIATASQDGLVQVWDTAGGTLRFTIAIHTDPVTSVTWSPDSTRVASSGMDGIMTIWNIETQEHELTSISLYSSVPRLRWSPVEEDFLLAAPGAEYIEILNPENFLRVRRFRLDDCLEPRWSANGGFMACANTQAIEVWDLALRQTVLAAEVGDGLETAIGRLSLAYDGRYLAGITRESEAHLLVWNVEDGAEVIDVLAYPNSSQHVVDVGWSPVDFRLFTYDSEDDVVMIWDGESGIELNQFELPTTRGSISSAAWSPNGEFIAVAYGSSVTIWAVPPDDE